MPTRRLVHLTCYKVGPIVFPSSGVNVFVVTKVSIPIFAIYPLQGSLNRNSTK